jgi:hypothetical protein
MVAADVPEPVIFGEMGSGRPLGIRVKWRDRGAHFAMCIGGDNAGFVTVADPHYGKSTIPYAMLRRYRYTGVWTHTYFTKR